MENYLKYPLYLLAGSPGKYIVALQYRQKTVLVGGEDPPPPSSTGDTASGDAIPEKSS